MENNKTEENKVVVESKLDDTDVIKTTMTDKKSVQTTLLERIAGDKASARKLYQPALPDELVAGSIPHIPGAEEESVWNAAVQACGTERVHFPYTVE